MVKRIAVVNGIVVTMNPQRDILHGGTVVTEDDRISAVLPKGAYQPDGTEEGIDAYGMVVIPGLVNAHMHSRPFRALGDGLPGDEWHDRYAQTLSKLMDEESTYIGALSAYAENVKGGATFVANMPPSVAGSDRAAQEIGLRAILFPHGGSDPKLKEANESMEESLANVRKAGDQKEKRVQIWFGFGHPGECDRDYFKKMRQYATRHQTGICGHVAISKKEIVGYQQDYGTSEIVKYYYDAGFLGGDVVLVHGIHLTPDEVKLMVETGTSLIHVPGAVLKGGHKITPVFDMMAAGLSLGIGTDGPLSTYRLDMFEVMRQTCFLQRVDQNSGAAFPSSRALELATLGGAKAFGLADEIGSLEVGKRADITMVNFQQPHLAPLVSGKHSNVVALLVFSCSASDVDTVIVDGRVIMRNRKLLLVDEKEIVSKVNELAAKALAMV